MNCPLCHGTSLNSLERIDRYELIKLWFNSKLDVSHLLRSDLLLKHCNTCGLCFYSPLIAGDDLFYGQLSEWSWYYKHPGKSEYSYSANLMSRGDRVIDIGCGIGEFSSYLPEGCSFTGIELSSRSVDIAKSLCRNVMHILVEEAALNYRQTFDYVVCFQVLEHLTSLDSFLTSCIDLCRKGGFIVFAVPNNDGFVGSAMNNFLNMPPHHTLLWNQKSLLFLAKKYNLKVLEYVNEPLQDVHKIWAYSIYVNAFIRNKLGLKERRIALSMLSKLIYKTSVLIARLLTFFMPRLIKEGHSSIVLLQKI